jgi:hypothetical protein
MTTANQSSLREGFESAQPLKTGRTAAALRILLGLLGALSLLLIISDWRMLAAVQNLSPRVLRYLPETHELLTWVSRSVFLLFIPVFFAWTIGMHRNLSRVVIAASWLLWISLAIGLFWIDVFEHKLTPGYLVNSIRLDSAVIVVAALTGFIVHRIERLQRTIHSES